MNYHRTELVTAQRKLRRSLLVFTTRLSSDVTGVTPWFNAIGCMQLKKGQISKQMIAKDIQPPSTLVAHGVTPIFEIIQ